jgi:predicted HicB family RNase H-like nuclease
VTGNRAGHTAIYTEMLELLGGAAADGPPPTELERFEAVMGIRRNPHNGAPMHYSEQERERMIRRVLAEHLANRPEVASSLPRQSAARLKVRFPRTLYRDIGAAAQADGTSMNTLVVAACAAYLGRRAAMQSPVTQTTDAPERLSVMQPWGERSG